jgi:cytidylate kinase
VVETARSLNLRLDYIDGKTVVHVDGINITEEIRSPEVSRLVSEVSKLGGVREAMVSLQRQLAGFGGVVMDGRDIGTHVLPNADLKLFLTASIEERARRRWLELRDKGYTVDIADLQQEIADRDKADCEREIAPLIQAADAVYLDTTALTIPEAVDKIFGMCEAKAGVL